MVGHPGWSAAYHVVMQYTWPAGLWHLNIRRVTKMTGFQ